MNLYSHTLEENDTATLFFRFVTRGNPAADIRQIAGLTDVPLRGFGDSDDNVGPSVSVSNVATEWVMGARPAIGGALEYSPNALAADTLYSVAGAVLMPYERFLRAAQLRRADHLHGLRDLLRRLDRADAPPDIKE